MDHENGIWLMLAGDGDGDDGDMARREAQARERMVVSMIGEADPRW